jgi:uncharacterized membrane protein
MESLVRAAERSGLPDIAEPIRVRVERALDSMPRVADVLHGRWLGHPLHAALTDVPVGAWTTGLVLDGCEAFGRTRRFRAAADTAHTVGLGVALLAALAGLADWSKTRGDARRVGAVHALANTVVAALFATSIVARKRGQRQLGIGASTLGYGVMLFSTWLGGMLTYRFGVGVRPVATTQSPELAPEAAAVPTSDELPTGEPQPIV